MKRDTFNAPRMKSGGHNRWVQRGMPQIPTRMPSGVLAYQAGQTLKDIKASTQRALEKFKPATPGIGLVGRIGAALGRFLRRTP